jgi:hypothetical protein
LVVESAKARHLKDELAECKSEYANLEAVAAEVEWLHTGTLSTMEAKYMSWVSSLGDERWSVVVAGRATCQAAYAQPGGPASSIEVASQLRGIPRRLEEIAQYGLSTRVHMALVTVGTIYTDLNIGSIGGKPVDTDPLLHSRI